VTGLVGDLGGGEEGPAVFEDAVPVAVLEEPAFGLPDPLRGDPGPARLGLGPVAGFPDNAVAVGEILAGDVEVVRSGGLARIFRGPVGGGSVLAEVDPVGPALAPEAGDAIPTLVVASPVAVDPEVSGGRVAPGSGDPDEVFAAGIPLPVTLDPLGLG